MTEQERIAITKYDLYYEARMTKVECAVDELKKDISEIKHDVHEIRKDMRNDFRWTLGIFLGSTAGTLITMAHGFKWF
jgi:hypothetical protein